jgi:hypothetical protein
VDDKADDEACATGKAKAAPCLPVHFQRHRNPILDCCFEL